MVIEYEWEKSGHCKTECPYGMTHDKALIYVGSDACQRCCGYVTSDDLTVTCNADNTQPNHETDEEISE